MPYDRHQVDRRLQLHQNGEYSRDNDPTICRRDNWFYRYLDPPRHDTHRKDRECCRTRRKKEKGGEEIKQTLDKYAPTNTRFYIGKSFRRMRNWRQCEERNFLSGKLAAREKNR